MQDEPRGARFVDDVEHAVLPLDFAQRLFRRHQVARNLAVEANFPGAVACGNRDGRAIVVDIPAHVFLDLPVLVLAFGCWIHRRFRTDRLPSSGATRVTGDKHTVWPWLDPQL